VVPASSKEVAGRNRAEEEMKKKKKKSYSFLSSSSMKKRSQHGARWSDARRALLATAPGDPGA
jgi:hypothetical protein